MSVHDVHPVLGRQPIPRPRTAGSHDALPADEASTRPPTQLPWPEPGRPALGGRPRTEYWDVETASWRSRD